MGFFVCIISDWSKSNNTLGIVSNHGGAGLKQQCAIYNFITFIAGILVLMHRPRNGIALGLFRYRDDHDWKTVLWAGLSELDLSFVQYSSESCFLRSSMGTHELILVDY